MNIVDSLRAFRNQQYFQDYIKEETMPFKTFDDEPPEAWDRLRKTPRDPADMQFGGEHYKLKKFQPIEYIMGNNLNFAEGNVVKYISRHAEKNGAEDVLKAMHYCKFILKHQYNHNEED